MIIRATTNLKAIRKRKVRAPKAETEMAPEMPIQATMTTTKVTKTKSFSLMKTLASLLMARRTKAKLVKLMSKMVMNLPLAPMSQEQEVRLILNQKLKIFISRLKILFLISFFICSIS